MSLKNVPNLKLLEKAEKIYQAALAEVKPENIIKKNVSISGKKLRIQDKIFDLTAFNDIFLIEIGKAAPFMAKSMLNILGNRVRDGLAVCLPRQRVSLNRITCFSSSHPLPDERSVVAARNILSLAKKAREKDLFIILISGGSSAQICLPASEISLEEKKFITEKLLKAGANITELNTVRKHISRIKGGRLAQEAYPATVISLVLSDVRGNDLESIASGPTHWDSSSYEDAFQVLKKYRLWNSAPFSVKEVVQKGIQDKIEETLREDNKIFNKVFNFIIGDNMTALQAAQKEAERQGFKSLIITSSDQGEARDTARNYASLFINIIQSGRVMSQPLCLLAGGEVTVEVKGKGRGGRNQEFVLAAVLEMKNRLKKQKNWMILSLNSDGIDGPTETAGAWATPLILKKAKRLFLNPKKYLSNNDSYNFFKKVGGLIFTGPTHTNVMDLRLFLIDT